MNLNLIGSTQLHSCIDLTCSINAGVGGGCYEYPRKVRGGPDYSCSVSSPFRAIRSSLANT